MHFSIVQGIKDLEKLLVFSEDRRATCPLCPETKYKPVKLFQLRKHFRSHERSGVRYEGFLVLGCHHDCKGNQDHHSHYHCVTCDKILARRATFEHHIRHCSRIKFVSVDNYRPWSEQQQQQHTSDMLSMSDRIVPTKMEAFDPGSMPFHLSNHTLQQSAINNIQQSVYPLEASIALPQSNNMMSQSNQGIVAIQSTHVSTVAAMSTQGTNVAGQVDGVAMPSTLGSHSTPRSVHGNPGIGGSSHGSISKSTQSTHGHGGSSMMTQSRHVSDVNRIQSHVAKESGPSTKTVRVNGTNSQSTPSGDDSSYVTVYLSEVHSYGQSDTSPDSGQREQQIKPVTNEEQGFPEFVTYPQSDSSPEMVIQRTRQITDEERGYSVSEDGTSSHQPESDNKCMCKTCGDVHDASKRVEMLEGHVEGSFSFAWCLDLCVNHASINSNNLINPNYRIQINCTCIDCSHIRKVQELLLSKNMRDSFNVYKRHWAMKRPRNTQQCLDM